MIRISRGGEAATNAAKRHGAAMEQTDRSLGKTADGSKDGIRHGNIALDIGTVAVVMLGRLCRKCGEVGVLAACSGKLCTVLQRQAATRQIQPVAYATNRNTVTTHGLRADATACGSDRRAVNGQRRHIAVDTAAAVIKGVALAAIVRFAAGSNHCSAAADGGIIGSDIKTHALGFGRAGSISVHGAAGGRQDGIAVHFQVRKGPHTDAVAGIVDEGRRPCQGRFDATRRSQTADAGDLSRAAEIDCGCLQTHAGKRIAAHGAAGAGQAAAAGGQSVHNINASGTCACGAASADGQIAGADDGAAGLGQIVPYAKAGALPPGVVRGGSQGTAADRQVIAGNTLAETAPRKSRGAADACLGGDGAATQRNVCSIDAVAVLCQSGVEGVGEVAVVDISAGGGQGAAVDRDGAGLSLHTVAVLIIARIQSCSTLGGVDVAAGGGHCGAHSDGEAAVSVNAAAGGRANRGQGYIGGGGAHRAVFADGDAAVGVNAVVGKVGFHCAVHRPHAHAAGIESKTASHVLDGQITFAVNTAAAVGGKHAIGRGEADRAASVRFVDEGQVAHGINAVDIGGGIRRPREIEVEITVKMDGQVAVGINAGVPCLVGDLIGSANGAVAGVGQRQDAVLIGGGVAAVGLRISVGQVPASAAAIGHIDVSRHGEDLLAAHVVAEGDRICLQIPGQDRCRLPIDGDRCVLTKQRVSSGRHRCIHPVVVAAGKYLVFAEFNPINKIAGGASPPGHVRYRVSAGSGGGAGGGADSRLGYADGNLSLPVQRCQTHHAGDLGVAHALYRHSITVNGTRNAAGKGVKIELWRQYHRQIISRSCLCSGGSRHFRGAFKSKNGPCARDVTKSRRGNTIRQGLPHNGTPHRDSNGRDRVLAYELCSRSRDRRRGQ